MHIHNVTVLQTNELFKYEKIKKSNTYSLGIIHAYVVRCICNRKEKKNLLFFLIFQVNAYGFSTKVFVIFPATFVSIFGIAVLCFTSENVLHINSKIKLAGYVILYTFSLLLNKLAVFFIVS